MKKNTLGIRFPSDEAFEKALAFLNAHPAFSYKQYISLFMKKYGDKCNEKRFADIIVRLFDWLED